MSKFLKIIVNLVIVCAILITIALLVPPLIGVDTVMSDNSSKETNIPVGSVAYGKTVNVGDLQKGDKILYTSGNQYFVYAITDMYASAGVYKVKDVYDSNADDTTVNLNKTASKVAVVVPFIAYAAMMLQSKEGLIILGLGVIFLIILFILAELWRRDESDEDEDDEAEVEDEEEEEEEEEEKLSFKERRKLKKEAKRQRKLEKQGLLEEDEEEPSEIPAEESAQQQTEAEIPVTAEAPIPEAAEPGEFDEAMKDAMASIASGIAGVTTDLSAEVPAEEPSFITDEETPDSMVQENQESTEEEENVEKEEQEQEEEMIQNKDAVLPAPSVTELLAKAEAAGESPEVIEDKNNEITLLDYSDLL